MTSTLNSIHYQATDWLKELKFYSDDLNMLTERLDEVAGKNTNKDVMKQVEHFQNNFYTA